MIFKDRRNKQGAALMTYIQRHMVVYTSWDQVQERESIDYISLSQKADDYQRAASLSLSANKSDMNDSIKG